MRILIYVEPVTFRFDPFFLRPWVEWLSTLVRAQSGLPAEFAFASSPWLCRLFATECADTKISIYFIQPVEALRAFGMDRVLYGEDLNRSPDSGIVNHHLHERISEIVSEFRPDAIFSFSQNRYLVSAATGSLTLFSELWPFPRSCCPSGFFIDPRGHQSDSMLVRYARQIELSGSQLDRDEILAFWDQTVVSRMTVACDLEDVAAWMAKETRGCPTVMLAAQPPDWLTFEGIYDRLPLDGMMMRWLDALPVGWRAIVTYHPAFRLSFALEQAIAEQMSNLIVLPEAWSSGRSEQLLPYVDAVATVSSSLGMTALLCGKKLISFGRSNLSGFAGSALQELDLAQPVSRDARAGLLCFLTNRYCHRADELLHKPGYFTNFVSELMNNRTAEFFLDHSTWSPERAARLLMQAEPVPE